MCKRLERESGAALRPKSGIYKWFKPDLAGEVAGRSPCVNIVQYPLELELRRSHLLGRAVYVLNRDGKDEPVMMTPQLITPTQRQLWRHLLCGDCEQRFSSYGESLIMRLVQRKAEFCLTGLMLHCRFKRSRLFPYIPGALWVLKTLRVKANVSA